MSLPPSLYEEINKIPSPIYYDDVRRIARMAYELGKKHEQKRVLELGQKKVKEMEAHVDTDDNVTGPNFFRHEIITIEEYMKDIKSDGC